MSTSASEGPRDRALIVAGNSGLRSKLAMALLRSDFEVATCSNEDEALKRVSESQPGLIIVDEGQGSGWELCRRLRRVSEAPIMLIHYDPDAYGWMETVKFGSGCYFRKWDGKPQLAFRARALLRQSQAPPRPRPPSSGPACLEAPSC